MNLFHSSIAILAAAAIAACGPSADAGRGEPDTDPIPPEVDLGTLSMPFDAYVRTFEQNSEIDRAVTVLAVQCLERFGFHVAAPARVAPVYKGHQGTYPLTDPDAAQRHGYHPDPAAVSARAKEPDLPPGAYAVMHGEVAAEGGHNVPEGGCLGEARRILGGVDQELVARAFALAMDASSKAQRDSRVTSAVARWSQCMKLNGYHYDDPWQANNDPRWQLDASPSQEEVQVATSDVGCKRQTRLIEIWVTVERAYQQRAIEENSAFLDELKGKLDLEYRKAADVLRGGTSQMVAEVSRKLSRSNLRTLFGVGVAIVVVLPNLLACGQPNSETGLNVELYVVACVNDGAECFNLGLPDANVTVTSAEGDVLVSSKTDKAGHAVLKTRHAGSVRVKAESPLLTKSAEHSTSLSGEGFASVTLWGHISPDAR